MYQINIKRDGNNPLTGRAQYRVFGCSAHPFSAGLIAYLPKRKVMAITSPSPKKIGTIINPRKELFGSKK